MGEVHLIAKTCTKCGVSKPLEEFKRRSGKGRKSKHHICRVCLHRQVRLKGYDYPSRRRYRALRLIWSNCKNRSEKRNVPFNITVSDIRNLWEKQEGKCAVTGLMMAPLFEVRGTGKVDAMSPSIDRIVPILGYVVGNLRFVCHSVNNFKMQMTDDEMLEIAKAIVRGLARKKRSK